MKHKILFIIPTLTQANGTAEFLQNYLRFMDLSSFEIHILCHDLNPSQQRRDFYKERGIPVHFIPHTKTVSVTKYLSKINAFFKDNRDFELIYSNLSYQSCLFFIFAKIYGMKNFAIHAHISQTTEASMDPIKKTVCRLLSKLSVEMSRTRFACSEFAGREMFGSRPFRVINNAIDYQKFQFDPESRKSVRESLHIDDSTRLPGFVGRFAGQKNIFFFICLAEQADANTKFLMVGTGFLKEKFVQIVNEKKLGNKFIFIDECADVYRYYSAMDVFLLPSLYEGLPVTAIEAQVNGLPCLFSDRITTECRISDSVRFLDISDPSVWVPYLRSSDRSDTETVNDAHDISVQSRIFQNILLGICEA